MMPDLQMSGLYLIYDDYHMRWGKGN